MREGWTIKTPGGKLLISYTSQFPTNTKDAFKRGWGMGKWKKFKKQGFRIVPVTVTEGWKR